MPKKRDYSEFIHMKHMKQTLEIEQLFIDKVLAWKLNPKYKNWRPRGYPQLMYIAKKKHRGHSQDGYSSLPRPTVNLDMAVRGAKKLPWLIQFEVKYIASDKIYKSFVFIKDKPCYSAENGWAGYALTEACLQAVCPELFVIKNPPQHLEYYYGKEEEKTE